MEADQQVIDGSEVESEAKLEPTAEDKITEGEDLLAEAKDGGDRDNETEVTTGQEEHDESVPVAEELDNEETPINDQHQPTTITMDESKSDVPMMPSIIISGEDLLDNNSIQQVPTCDDTVSTIYHHTTRGSQQPESVWDFCGFVRMGGSKDFHLDFSQNLYEISTYS